MEDNFILGFSELCSGTEIPEIFAAWSGIAGISCVLGRKVWLDMGTFTIYPNLYICLVGGSGKVRKSTSIGVIERVLRSLQPGPNLIAQKITPEGLIDALRIKEQVDHTRLLAERSDGFVIVDELATFLNKSSYEAGLAALLISFFDCKDSFEYRTKGGGSQKITNVCLGMLSASTVDWITNAVPENAVGGGLTSRFVFVYVDTPAKLVPRPEYGEKKRALQEEMERSIARISQITGPVRLTDAAWKFYDEEYLRFREGEGGAKLYENKTLYGYASRRHVHQLKIAMCLAASVDPTLVVTEEHILGATALLHKTEQHLPMLMSLITSSDYGTMLLQVKNTIFQRKVVTRKDLLRAVGHKIGSRDLDMFMETLINGGWVEVEYAGSMVNYRARSD